MIKNNSFLFKKAKNLISQNKMKINVFSKVVSLRIEEIKLLKRFLKFE